jgi:hypothetical protein
MSRSGRKSRATPSSVIAGCTPAAASRVAAPPYAPRNPSTSGVEGHADDVRQRHVGGLQHGFGLSIARPTCAMSPACCAHRSRSRCVGYSGRGCVRNLDGLRSRRRSPGPGVDLAVL